MNKNIMITLGLTTLLISACGEAPEQSSMPTGDSGSAMPESSMNQTTTGTTEAPTLIDKTKEVTGETLEAVGDTSKEVYESAKETAIEVGEAVSDKTSEVYESAKETTTEAYEATKDAGSALIEDVTPPAQQQ